MPEPRRVAAGGSSALVAGALAAGMLVDCPAPTGNGTIDLVLVAIFGVSAGVLGSRAPARFHVAAATVALVVSLDERVAVLAVAALLLALVPLVVRRIGDRTRALLSAASWGLCLNALSRSELQGFVGLSSLVAIATSLVVALVGLRAFSRPVRRATWAACGVVTVTAIAATAGFAYETLEARRALVDGVRAAEKGVAAIESGDFDAAATFFEQSADLLDDAHDRLDSVATFGARAVPVVAQHRDAAAEMSGVGSTGAAAVADALSTIDLDQLRVEDSRLDLEALAALTTPLEQVHTELLRLRDTSVEADSVWLVDMATRQLDDFDESIAEHLPSLERAIEAIGLAPDLLGASGPRTYLLLFTTPSESRGLGGFIGSYAELHVDDGVLTLGQAGNAGRLDARVEAAGARIDGFEEFRARYGQFGFDRAGDGVVGDAAFRNLAMTPNFPWVGAIAADLYEQTTGTHIDGVIAVDPLVVATLLRYTGPIHLDSLDVDLTIENAVPFLLRDQYVLGADDVSERRDALGEAASTAFERLMGGDLPDPISFSREIGPLVDERRLLLWSAHPSEQVLLDDLSASGAIPTPSGRNGWAVTITNAAGNKIDSFLERRADFTTSTGADGLTSSSIRLELHNGAPDSGLPEYIIGGRSQLPLGTTRLYVSFYSPLELVAATLDGAPLTMDATTERGWNVYSAYVDIPSGGSVEFAVDLSGRLAEPDDIVTWVQPMANPLEPI